MTKARRNGLLAICICGALSVLWGCSLGWKLSRGPMDYQAIYYGSKTLMAHRNPYRVPDVQQTYHDDGAESQKVIDRQYENMTLFVNTPGALLCVAPFALLPVLAGQIVWLILSAGSLCLAAFLMWDIASTKATAVASLLTGFLLLNCPLVIAAGNTAAIVVGFCVIAAWCFIRNRFVIAGVFLMAISLAIKPHDSGLVFLFFFLAGSRYRKLALQSALITAVIYAVAMLWLSSVAPTWLHDWQANLATISAPGSMNDPRPGSVASQVGAATVISLQAVFSIFRDSSSFYNMASYLVCGLIMLPWAVSTTRSPSMQTRSWFALAAIAPLTMLVIYHRVYDAKLLLLCIPACAALWAKRGRIGWAAMILTTLGLVVSADVPLAAYGILLQKIHLSVATLPGQLLTLLIARPSQVALLAMSLFYLWVYLQKDPAMTHDDSGSSSQEAGTPYTSNHADA